MTKVRARLHSVFTDYAINRAEIHPPGPFSHELMGRVMKFTNPLQGLSWRTIVKVWKPFWTSDQRNKNLLLLGAIILLLITSVGVNWASQKLTAELWTAIETKSSADTNYWLLISVAVIAPFTLVQVYYGMLRTKLGLAWRDWLTASLLTGYYNEKTQAASKINGNAEIDNPDSRITGELDSFCNQSVWLPISFLENLVTIITFGGTLIYLTWQLGVGAILCAFIMSVGVVWLGQRLVPLANQQNKTEGDLRYWQASVREQTENVSFYRGEKVAFQVARNRLSAVIATLTDVMYVNRNISFFTTSFNMLVVLVPLYLVVGLYFDGAIKFGAISQATGAFAAVYGGLCWIANQFGGLSSYANVVKRLAAFMDAIEAAGVDTLPPEKRIQVTEADEIDLNKVTVMTPDLQKTLVVDLTVNVKPGANLLLTGPDGSGKTAILRVIAGLWMAGSGSMKRPAMSEVMYLSQAPFLPQTSLRTVLTYPMAAPVTDDARLMEVLKLVGLTELLERASGLDTEQNWRQMLSPSEQQRLGLARIILCKPKYVIVDDATAALENETEQLLYTVLTTIGATVVTAGNGAALVKYHQQVLELKGDGTWSLQDAASYKPKKFFNLLAIFGKTPE
jgi:putative ATP-binding cassette transporter